MYMYIYIYNYFDALSLSLSLSLQQVESTETARQRRNIALGAKRSWTKEEDARLVEIVNQIGPKVSH